MYWLITCVIYRPVSTAITTVVNFWLKMHNSDHQGYYWLNRLNNFYQTV